MGVFEDARATLGGLEVRCPVCGEHSAAAWKRIGFQGSLSVEGFGMSVARTTRSVEDQLSLEWMHCANEKCGEVVVLLTENWGRVGPDFAVQATSWIVWPRLGEVRRHVDDAVPESFGSDYQEAAVLLDVSPRMSAVMSRRILADLLENYAGLTQFNLEKRIDAFIADTSHPRQLRENLHHFREGANFGAHTQKDDQAEVIDISREEAEWMLDLLDRLFEYFIVTPRRDQAMRDAIDVRIKEAGRKEIKPLSEDPEGDVN